jgi:hypothetical protein
MTFTTYENHVNRHITIHHDWCRQIRKRGGKHKYNQGRYVNHSTYEAAEKYARESGLPIINCSFCKPPSGS